MASVAKRTWTYKGAEKTAWVVRWKDQSGHRSRQFEKKKEADTYRQKIEGQASEGTLAPNAAIVTVQALTRDWMLTRERMHREGRLARSSITRDAYHVLNHIDRVLGSLRVGDLTARDVDGFVANLRDWKNIDLPGNMAPATVRHITRTLAAVLDYGKRRGLVGVNVARDVLTWPEHREPAKTRIRTFTVEEIRRLLAATSTRMPYQMLRSVIMARAAIYLGAFCGLRYGEVQGLTLQAIDFDGGRIAINKSLDRWGNHKGPKTAAGRRVVPMPDAVALAIKDWLAYATPNDLGLIFSTRQGKHMRPGNFHRDIWRPVLKAAGLDPDAHGHNYHFHALRHFYASMMVEARLPDADTAKLMGHASFDTTLRIYTHSTAEDDFRHSAPDALATRLLAPPPITQEKRTAA